MSSVRQCRWVALTLCVTLFGLRAWFMTTLPLSGDEAYHWEWSRHLALGYHDHPGMTAWLIAASTHLFGVHSEFSVRLPALLSLAGVWVLAYFFARRVVTDLGGMPLRAERAGLLAMVLLMFAPITLVFSVYISTDPPLQLFWMASLYAGYRAIEGGTWRWWLLTGLAFGLALESKFLALLLLPCGAVFLFLARRRVRLRPGPILGAAAVATACMLPLGLWNLENDWATFVFNFRARHRSWSPSWKYPLEYVAGQLALWTPVLFVAMAIASVHAWRERTRAIAPLYLVVFCMVPLAGFLFVSLQRGVGAHWPTAAWFSMIVYYAAAFGLERAWVGPRLVRWCVGLCVGLTVAMHLIAHIPQRYLDFDLEWFGRPHAVRVKAMAERYGWTELGIETVALRDRLAAVSGRPAFIACAQYGLAASVAFYGTGQPKTHLWCAPRRHGDNYRLWDDYAGLAGRDAVFVVKRNPQHHRESLEAHFRSVDAARELRIVDDGHYVRSFYLIPCHGFDGLEPFPRDSD